MTTYLVYKHTAPNGKAYVGITDDYERRCKQHKSASKQGVGCRAFGVAIKKYGWNNFKHEILEAGLTAEEAKLREVALIAEHNTLAPNGYNLTEGGEHGTHSEETKELLRQKSTGRVHSEETKRALSDMNGNRPQEWRDKLGVSMSAALTGKPKSPEHIEKVRAALNDDPDKKAARIKKSADANRGSKHDNTGALTMWANRSEEEVAALQAKRLASLDREALSAKMKASHASMTAEQKAQRAANIKAALAHRVQTPEQKEAARLRRNELQRERRAKSKSS